MGFYAGQFASILHARLGVINPGDDGLQPIWRNGDVLAFNGEIYNWQKLKEQGERTDTEVLLRMWQQAPSKDEMLQKLAGFWSFAVVHDSVRDPRVQLVRDQFGARPLYYAIVNSTLIAASSIRAIHKLLPEKPSLNHKALSEWARYQMVFGHHTFFEGINRVMPGEVVAWDGKNLTGHQYDDIWHPGSEPADEAWISEAQELLVDCVNEATVSDVPFTSTCSGGLDSSIVTRLSNPGLAYHSNYTGKDFNETEHAKAATAGTSTRLFVHNATEQPAVVDRVRSIVLDQDDLSVGSVVLPLDELMGEVGRRYRVTMLGTGGDELFGGYARLDLARGLGNHPGYAASAEKLQDIDGVIEKYERLHVKGTPNLYKFYDHVAVDSFMDALNDKHVGTADETRMLDFERRQFLPALLTIDDRIAGRHGVEGRPALLHQKFVRHVAKLSPVLMLARPLKYVARQVFAPWLPKSVLDRTDKKGFPTPVGAMMNANSAQVREYITTHKAREMFNLDRVRWTTEDPYDRGLFGLLQLAAWLESFDAST